MPYKVEYTSATRPADLPTDAVVTEVGHFPLPHTVVTGMRELRIDSTGSGSLELRLKSTLTPNNSTLGYFSYEQSREIAHAILEAIGDPIPGTVVVTHLKDRDGDIWTLRDNGKYSITGIRGINSIEDVEGAYGPLTPVTV